MTRSSISMLLLVGLLWAGINSWLFVVFGGSQPVTRKQPLFSVEHEHEAEQQHATGPQVRNNAGAKEFTIRYELEQSYG